MVKNKKIICKGERFLYNSNWLLCLLQRSDFCLQKVVWPAVVTEAGSIRRITGVYFLTVSACPFLCHVVHRRSTHNPKAHQGQQRDLLPSSTSHAASYPRESRHRDSWKSPETERSAFQIQTSLFFILLLLLRIFSTSIPGVTQGRWASPDSKCRDCSQHERPRTGWVSGTQDVLALSDQFAKATRWVSAQVLILAHFLITRPHSKGYTDRGFVLVLHWAYLNNIYFNYYHRVTSVYVTCMWNHGIAA